MAQSVSLKLSPSSLNAFRECPRCFWNDMHGKGPPKGIFPSLPGGIDIILKGYYDKYRAKGLPPLLKGKLDFTLVDQQLADRVRKYINWTDEETGAVLRGKMDDCFIDETGKLVVMDNKTRGFPLKESAENDELSDIYAFQLESYAFLLAKNGFDVRDFGYLVYYIPDQGESEITDGIRFSPVIKKIPLSTGRVIRVFRDAVKIARHATPPAQHKDCEMCLWVKAMIEG